MLNSLKTQMLRSVYALSPFDLKGDGWFLTEPSDEIKISCVINFYGRLDLLGGILHSLASQVYPTEHLEVILVEDQGGTEAGRTFCESFAGQLPIVYQPLDKNFGQMGYSRNFGLSLTRGEYVLFLDDDTVILQDNFLTLLEHAFRQHPEVDAFLPCGNASFAEWPGGYDFHDPYFPTSRCTAYRRSVLVGLGGFMSSFVGQEDVEFVIRFTLAGKKSLSLPDLNYFHPPLLVSNYKKPAAVGISFARMRGRYSSPLLWLSALNCSRHAPLLFSWQRRHREMGRFGIGFFRGFVKGWFKPQAKATYG